MGRWGGGGRTTRGGTFFAASLMITGGKFSSGSVLFLNEKGSNCLVLFEGKNDQSFADVKNVYVFGLPLCTLIKHPYIVGFPD